MLFDIYCPITGWAYMESGDEFIDDISGAITGDYLWGDKVALKGRRVPSRAVREGLEYTDEDIEAMSKYVLITPREMNEDGEWIVPELLSEPVKIVDEKTVTYVFGVRPTSKPNSGVYSKGQGDDEINYEDIGDGRIVVHFCAFLILQHLIPGLRAHVFYKLVIALGGRRSGVLRNVQYGPVGSTQEREVNWGMIPYHYFDDEMSLSPGCRDWWLKLLTQEDLSDEEILQDAWMGWGNMWVFKHPGLFPIAEAVELAENCPQILFTKIGGDGAGSFKSSEVIPLLALPRELMELVFGYLSPRSVLNLISTTKVLYEGYRGHLDRFTYLWIQQQRPWYLPVGPIECEEGDTEIVCWEDDWEKSANEGIQGSEAEKEKPWFAYYLACERSPNVRSRGRIWDVVLQIKRILAGPQFCGLNG